MHLSYQVYNYPFPQPLVTHHGTWNNREGIIISLVDSAGNIGQGEIAPLHWFGSEILAEALSFIEALQGEITEEKIYEIPYSLPCCQFAFEAAIFHLSHPILKEHNLNYSRLLQAGEKALKQVIEGDSLTYKWKIGVYSSKVEQDIFLKLIEQLPLGSRLRLDANGGLTLEEAEKWLALLDNYQDRVEYLEQPLLPEKLDIILQLNQDYITSIALDESVCSIAQIENCYQRGWRGIYVIKAPIMGSIAKLRYLCLNYKLDTVFSTVFETSIGRSMSLYLAQDLANTKKALGYAPPC